MDESKTKVCRHCKLHLPLEEFTKNRAEKDGLDGYCRACRKLMPFPIPKKKACAICHIMKPIKDFLNDDTGRYSKFCYKCLPRYELLRYYKKSREKPEEMKTYHREYKRKYRKQLKAQLDYLTGRE